jgi:hypothetical protein
MVNGTLDVVGHAVTAAEPKERDRRVLERHHHRSVRPLPLDVDTDITVRTPDTPRPIHTTRPNDVGISQVRELIDETSSTALPGDSVRLSQRPSCPIDTIQEQSVDPRSTSGLAFLDHPLPLILRGGAAAVAVIREENFRWTIPLRAPGRLRALLWGAGGG